MFNTVISFRISAFIYVSTAFFTCALSRDCFFRWNLLLIILGWFQRRCVRCIFSTAVISAFGSDGIFCNLPLLLFGSWFGRRFYDTSFTCGLSKDWLFCWSLLLFLCFGTGVIFAFSHDSIFCRILLLLLGSCFERSRLYNSITCTRSKCCLFRWMLLLFLLGWFQRHGMMWCDDTGVAISSDNIVCSILLLILWRLFGRSCFYDIIRSSLNRDCFFCWSLDLFLLDDLKGGVYDIALVLELSLFLAG